jgi:hypothetical protein
MSILPPAPEGTEWEYGLAATRMTWLACLICSRDG